MGVRLAPSTWKLSGPSCAPAAAAAANRISPRILRILMIPTMDSCLRSGPESRVDSDQGLGRAPRRALRRPPAVVDPEPLLGVLPNEFLEALAEGLRQRLRRVRIVPERVRVDRFGRDDGMMRAFPVDVDRDDGRPVLEREHGGTPVRRGGP